MYEHTQYPSIPNLKPPIRFRPTYVQEKLDGANIRIIVPRDGSRIILGTRRTILNGERDFKRFKQSFFKELEEIALKNLKPIIDGFQILYDEFVVYGELVGPSIFSRLNYRIKNLEVYVYDLFLFNEGKRTAYNWTFKQLQENLEICKFKVIPIQLYTVEMKGDEFLKELENARSFLNPEEKIEGYILRDSTGKRFKYKGEIANITGNKQGNQFSLPLNPTEDLYRDLENKYAGFKSLTPEKIVSLMVADLIENFQEVKEKFPSKSWIWNSCRNCFVKFFPGITLNKEIIQSAINLLE